MAKTTKTTISSGFNSNSAINDNFDRIDTELNDKVLYRDNPTGQPNQMQNDLDMNSNDILNGGSAGFTSLSVNGNNITSTDAAVSTLPDQSGNSGKFLTTNGTTASWDDVKFSYTTVALMKAATTLDSGDVVNTLGYAALNDKGGAKYIVVTAGEYGGTPDEKGDHTLGNGNIAVLQENVIDAVKFGAKAGTDSTASIQAAIDAATDVVEISVPGTYTVTTLTNPNNVKLVGEGVVISGHAIPVYSRHDARSREESIQPLLNNINFPLNSSTEELTVTGFPEYKPCFDGDGFLWVPCFGNLTTINPTVSKIDTVKREVVETIVVNNGPYACVYDPVNDRVWVVCSGTVYNDATAYGSSIEIIVPQTGAIESSITSFGASVKLGGGLYEPETQSVWVGDGAATGTDLYKIPVATKTIAATVTVDTGPTGIAYAPNTGDIYVACYNQPSLVRVDPATAAKVGSSLAIGTNPVDVVYCPLTEKLYVTDNINGTVGSPSDHGLFIVDPTNMTEVAKTSSTEFDPFGACYDPVSNVIAFMCFTDGRVNRVNPYTYELVDSFPTNAGGGAQGVIADINNPGVLITTNNGVSSLWFTYAGEGSHSPAVKKFTSAAQTITSAGTVTIAHGLSVVPRHITFRLVCTTGELGYNTNDVVLVNPAGNDPGSGTSIQARGISVVYDNTNIAIRYGSSANVFGHVRHDTGAQTALTNANWQLYVEAWA